MTSVPMSSASMSSARWLKLGALTLVLAALMHAGIVWLVPRVITGTFIKRLSAQAGTNRVVLPPLPSATSRGVVKPSPDLLYAVCVFDLTKGPVRVAATLPGGYWSMAFYAPNSDNFFTLSEREITRPGADSKGLSAAVILLPPGSTRTFDQPVGTVVHAPSTTGVMLARSLVLDPANMQEQLAARAKTRCEPLGKG